MLAKPAPLRGSKTGSWRPGSSYLKVQTHFQGKFGSCFILKVSSKGENSFLGGSRDGLSTVPACGRMRDVDAPGTPGGAFPSVEETPFHSLPVGFRPHRVSTAGRLDRNSPSVASITAEGHDRSVSLPVYSGSRARDPIKTERTG